MLVNDLHHAHHCRLHEIVALIGKPAGAEPADGSDQILAQLRVVDPWSPVETKPSCGFRRVFGAQSSMAVAGSSSTRSINLPSNPVRESALLERLSDDEERS